jgi:hypothetical protein
MAALHSHGVRIVLIKLDRLARDLMVQEATRGIATGSWRLQKQIAKLAEMHQRACGSGIIPPPERVQKRLEADCGYREFHVLGADVVAAGKARRVAFTQESNPGLAGRWQAQISTGVHSGGFTERSDGELYRLGSFQAARRP